MISKYVKDLNILNVYQFGSQVYGTATPESDTDLIVVAKEWFDSEDINVHVYTVEQFQLALDQHDIQAMECVCSQQTYKHKETIPFNIGVINLPQLRKSISTICNNSWVKGKKKLIIAGDYDLNLAIKSVFHSIRIYDFGIQIATSGHIYNFRSSNYILDDLKLLSTRYQRGELWEQIENKYKKHFNQIASNFKKVAPKDITEKSKIKELENILTKHFGVVNDDLRNEILLLFEK